MVVALSGFVAGLALSRLLYEGLFPAWGWMGRPIPALVFGSVIAVVVGLATTRAARRWGEGVALAALPLLLNLTWLVDPNVGLERSRFLFGASLWLGVVLLVWSVIGDTDRCWRRLGPLFVAVALLPVYLLTMSRAVGAADTFEFQVVAPRLGIAHPTGYPLYLLLGKLFSLLPVSTVAWRLNLASAVFATLAAMVVFRLGLRLVRRPLPALVGAVALGLVPIYWGQAIVAEVYALHALIVAGALLLMMRLVDAGGENYELRITNYEVEPDLTGLPRPVRSSSDRKTMVALAFLLGLGLANHLTTVFLLPPAALAIALNLFPRVVGNRLSAVSRRRSVALLLLQLTVAFTLPLLLYAYLPLRWAVVNGEPMGLDRFIEWVVGGRFQGALQWGAWLRDPTRREIVGRLLFDAWGRVYLGLAAVGLGWLLWRQWRAGLVLLVTAAGFTFYALNYYVPDLAVFLIPTHVVIAAWVAAGVWGLIDFFETRFFPKNRVSKAATPLLFLLAMLPALLTAGERWPSIDQSARNGGEPWARGVLAQPLAEGGAILADGEKIAPLYYLQQAEGMRPDLDIMVLPDEAAYRAELDARLAAGGTVYLARFLPGLEGVYHLRSAGPLVEVSREPLTEMPVDVMAAEQAMGPLRLLGYAVEPVSAVDPNAALTLYWTREHTLDDGERTPVLYLRWSDGDTTGEPVVAGPHPVSDTYPVNAWRPGEIVPDYHLLPLPDLQCDEAECAAGIQVAIAPRFTPAEELDWQTVTSVSVAPRPGPVGRPWRVYFDGFALDGVDFPMQARAGAALPFRYSGYGDGLDFLLVPPHAVSSFVFPANGVPPMRIASDESIVRADNIEPKTEQGPYVLVALPPGDELRAVCHWMAWPTTGCVVAEIDVSGVPLPEGAVSFADRIALLDVNLPAGTLTLGGQLPVEITWQGLAEMDEDYTVFVQVLDAADRIVGQVDSWPVQGTRPTSGWQPGETVRDPYVVQLSPDMEPGDYRVIVGLYLLATGQRLPVVDEAGNAVDDKVEVALIFD